MKDALQGSLGKVKAITNWLWYSGFVLVTPPIVIVAIVLFWFNLLEIPPVTPEQPNTLYLLSAMAQSLAAVFALVFTITLVAVQLSSRYSYRTISSFIDPFTLFYMFLFISAILIPLGVLVDPDPALVKVSITLTVTCLLLLIPYFISFKDKPNPESMVNGLVKKAMSERKNPIVSVSAIDNITMSAFVQKDYDTLNRGLESLSYLAFDLYERNGEQENTGYAILERIRDIGLVTIDDPRAPMKVLDVLYGVADRASGVSSFNFAITAIRQTEDIGIRSVELKLEDVTMQVICNLKELGGNVARLDFDCDKLMAESSDTVVYEIVRAISNLGIKTSEKVLEAPMARAAEAIERVVLLSEHPMRKNSAQIAVDALGRINYRAIENNFDRASVVATGALVNISKQYSDDKNINLQVAIRLWNAGADAFLRQNQDLVTQTQIGMDSILAATSHDLISNAYRRAQGQRFTIDSNGNMLEDRNLETI